MADYISRRLDDPTQEGPWEINSLLQRKLGTRDRVWDPHRNRAQESFFLPPSLCPSFSPASSFPHQSIFPTKLASFAVSVCGGEVGYRGRCSSCQLSWVWAHPVSTSLGMSLKVSPEVVNRGKKMASWMNDTTPLATVPDLMKRGTVKSRQSTRSYLFFNWSAQMWASSPLLLCLPHHERAKQTLSSLHCFRPVYCYKK